MFRCDALRFLFLEESTVASAPIPNFQFFNFPKFTPQNVVAGPDHDTVSHRETQHPARLWEREQYVKKTERVIGRCPERQRFVAFSWGQVL